MLNYIFLEALCLLKRRSERNIEPALRRRRAENTESDESQDVPTFTVEQAQCIER